MTTREERQAQCSHSDWRALYHGNKIELFSEIADLKRKLEAEQGYSSNLIRERDGMQQHAKDIRFMINYWDNSCGNALELYIDREMIVSERITKEMTKDSILERIIGTIKDRLVPVELLNEKDT